MAEKSKPQRRLVSIPTAAAELGVSERTVRRRIADGTLRAKRIGPRLIRIHAESLDELVGS